MQKDRQTDDFEWYMEHMPELYQRYGSCFVAIKDKHVIGVYPSFNTGVDETSKTEDPGTFIVQEVGPDESVYTVELPSLLVSI